MMLIVRIVAVLAVVSAATGVVMLKTGKVEKLERENGIHQQTIIQKEQMAAQSLQIAREAEEEARRLEQEAKKAYEQLSEIQKQFRESQEQVNDLLVKIRETANEDSELQVWGGNRHPESVVSLYQSATSADSPETDCGDEASLCPPAP